MYDSTTKDEDNKRFATLNLFVPMQIRADGLGVVKPQVVFRGKFQTAEEWHDREEAAKWHKGVAVIFQENAWVDARTHMVGLKEVLGPVDELLASEGSTMKGIVIEDNLSSHKTDAVDQFWIDELPNFEPALFVPPNMTSYLQVVDRHIGLRYKKHVYKMYRKEMVRRLNEKMAALNADTSIPRMTPAEKRILITHAVGDIHEKMCKSTAFQHAFFATGTWLPISHLIRNRDSAVPALEDTSHLEVEKLVKIQHFKEYKYTEKITPVAVHQAIDKAAADKAVKEAEDRRFLVKKEAHQRADKLELQPYIDKAEKLLPELEERLQAYIQGDVGSIHHETGLEEFLVAGSWPSSIIAKVLSEWTDCADLADFDELELKANDIDVYHGHQSNDGKFVVDFSGIKKYPVSSLFLELNTVKCQSWSAAGFLSNNDINLTASCFDIDLTRDKWLHVHASPRFWKFLFSTCSDRTIEVVDTYDYSKYTATTCVRMAFKHFHMPNFKLSMMNLDPTMGTLACSQKEKLDKMKSWTENPLKAYDCKKKMKQNYYYLVARDNQLVCADCRSSRVNKSCSTVRCKKCCVEYCFGENQTCKCKDHVKGMKERKQRALEELAEAGILDEVNMEEFNEGEADVGDEDTADSE